MFLSRSLRTALLTMLERPTKEAVARSRHGEVVGCTALWLLSVISSFLLLLRVGDLCDFYAQHSTAVFHVPLWWGSCLLVAGMSVASLSVNSWSRQYASEGWTRLKAFFQPPQDPLAS